MSEYAGSQQPKHLDIDDLDHSGTLFDDDSYDRAVQHLVDTGTDSYYTAHKRVGDRPSSKALGAVEIPIAVDIQERALALEAIAAYLNKANQVNGSATLLDNGGGKFRERYGVSANDVQRGAEVKLAMMRTGFMNAIKTLAATEAMQLNGLDEDKVEAARMNVQMLVNRELGVGNANAKKRNDVVKTAQKTAKNLR